MSIEYIETMAEVNDIPFNGLNVVSTFSGGGGSCLGYRIAGCKVLWANEFIPEARKTYRLNNDYSHLDGRDIREVTADDIREVIGDIDVDIFDGSPPCSAFSIAGSREKGWDKVKKYSDKSQRTDDLFFEYIRLVKDINPKIFIAENVTGLTQGKAKGYFNEILRTMQTDLNHEVKVFILNTKNYGIPQSRSRAFFIGIRKDIGGEITPPPQRRKITVVSDYIQLADIKTFCAGGFKNDERWKIASKYPYPTVVANIGNNCASTYMSVNGFIRDPQGVKRKMTLEECKVICSFPMDFKLSGIRNKGFERLGRAVPPLMMAQLVKHLAERHL